VVIRSVGMTQPSVSYATRARLGLGLLGLGQPTSVLGSARRNDGSESAMLTGYSLCREWMVVGVVSIVPEGEAAQVCGGAVQRRRAALLRVGPVWTTLCRYIRCRLLELAAGLAEKAGLGC
jgi:hypothetical protein